MSLDSVLFADGTLAGPDRSGMGELYAARLQGDMSLARAVLAFKGDEAGLTQYLEGQATAKPVADRAIREMRIRAIQIQHALKRRTLEAELAVVAELYNTAASITVHRVN